MKTAHVFSINAKTCTLKYNNQQGKATILGNGTKYIIPIYQRPYSWTDEQLRKFITDIFGSFWGADANAPAEPMFIGTMQLSYKTKENVQEIIDGQQRLTTFLLLIKVLRHRFPHCQELQNISLNWLYTRVNNGAQQRFLDHAIASDLSVNSETQNRYLKNALLINEQIDEHINNEEDKPLPFNIDKFFTYLLSNVYFVVIETKAGLSKTLQIFNAINTTGLDLNGGDIFKIKMYEYLKDKKGANEMVFEEISHLYEKIDDHNEALGHNAINISGILKTYQYILIARYGLPVALYNYGVDRFFEQLFNTILGIEDHEYFKNNVACIDLSVAEIERVIEVSYKWQCKWKTKEGFTAEDACAFYFIWWSRYSHYWDLTFVLLYRLGSEASSWSAVLEFNRQLGKLFFIYSVRFQKLKSDIYYSFMHKVIDTMVNKSFKEVMELINGKIGKLEDHTGWYDLNWFLSEKLTENAKRKNLICRMSAMLCEDYTTTNIECVKDISTRLFETAIDIEHIQSYYDRNKEIRQDIWKEWHDNINSLGNLMILERKINQSISNGEYSDKLKRYPESIFTVVRNQCYNYSHWDLSKCIERKEIEKRKILNYIFG